MRLLCATDLSSRSDRALRRAGVLARAADAELVLLSVVDDDQPTRLVKSERREVTILLAEQSRTMHELQGLQPRLRVEVGDAFDAIIRVADAEEADLVVMGEHRKRLLRDVFVGTTIERVMRLGNRPVLMVNGPAERPYRRILAAVDASEPAAHALRTAHRLGFLARAELTAFHAFELLPGREVMMRADVCRRGNSGACPGDGGRATRGAGRLSAGHRSWCGVAPPAARSGRRSARPGAASNRGAVVS